MSNGLFTDAARFLLTAYTTPYIDTSVLPAGLSKLVYVFHPAKSAESPAPFSELEFEDQEQHSGPVSSPMDSTCVTSPECGGSQGRSPFDHEFDADVKSHKEAIDESPRETALMPGTTLLDRFPIANDSSSADKLLENRARSSSRKRVVADARSSSDSRGKKFKYCL